MEDATIAANNNPSLRTKEADLKNRLDNPQDDSGETQETLESDTKTEETPDYQLSQALNLLKGFEILSNR